MTCFRSTSTPASIFRRTRRARTSTTSPTCRRSRRRCSTPTSARRARSVGWRSATRTRRPAPRRTASRALASQTEHVEGAPFGTRGGTSVVHTFPADGEYLFKVLVLSRDDRALRRRATRAASSIEISIDGERAARARHRSIHDGVGSQRRHRWRPNPIRVRAGPHRISAAFIPPSYQRVVAGPDHAAQVVAEQHSHRHGYGFSLLPHLRDLVVTGPFKPTGVSDSPARHAIFTCSVRRADGRRVRARDDRRASRDAGVPPSAHAGRYEVAHGVLRWRRHGDPRWHPPRLDTSPACGLRSRPSLPARILCSASSARPARRGRATTLSRERPRSRVAPVVLPLGRRRRTTSCCRSPTQGKLVDEAVLEPQVRRMLADPRREHARRRGSPRSGCGCQDLDKVQPGRPPIPRLRRAARAAHAARDGAVLRAARARRPQRARSVHRRLHVRQRAAGAALRDSERRRAGVPARQLTDEQRRGLLGQASVLMLTSHATRTSPVLRGKWVMEVLLGTPPPPPPPGVPDSRGDARTRRTAGC